MIIMAERIAVQEMVPRRGLDLDDFILVLSMS